MAAITMFTQRGGEAFASPVRPPRLTQKELGDFLDTILFRPITQESATAFIKAWLIDVRCSKIRILDYIEQNLKNKVLVVNDLNSRLSELKGCLNACFEDLKVTGDRVFEFTQEIEQLILCISTTCRTYQFSEDVSRLGRQVHKASEAGERLRNEVDDFKSESADLQRAVEQSRFESRYESMQQARKIVRLNQDTEYVSNRMERSKEKMSHTKKMIALTFLIAMIFAAIILVIGMYA